MTKWYTIQWKWSEILKFEHDTSFWQKLDSIDQNDFMVSVTDTERSLNVPSNNWIKVQF